MDGNFNFSYKKLMGTTLGQALADNPPRPVVDSMTSLMDDNHTPLLHALLEELKADGARPQVLPHGDLFRVFQRDLNNIAVDFHKRLLEFRKLWVDRFEPVHMLPTLKKYGWIENRGGAYYLAGKGDVEESINFYKFTVKDLVAEAVRITALFDGALSRVQEKAADLWHRETDENSTRLLPLFESSLRSKEMASLKNIRRKLPEYFRRDFCAKIRDWDEVSFQTEDEFYQKVLWPWYRPYHNKNGFEGYLFFVEEFIWELIKLKMDLFERKWRMLLRGLHRPDSALAGPHTNSHPLETSASNSPASQP